MSWKPWRSPVAEPEATEEKLPFPPQVTLRLEIDLPGGGRVPVATAMGADLIEAMKRLRLELPGREAFQQNTSLLDQQLHLMGLANAAGSLGGLTGGALGTPGGRP